MKHRMFRRVLSCLAVIIFGELACFGQAAERVFELSGTPIAMREVSSGVAVYYSSMRLDRGANEWNVDVTISNRTSSVVASPLVLLVDTLAGTTGPLRPDGRDGEKAFFEMTKQSGLEGLSQGGRTQTRTLAFGISGGAAPRFTAKVFSPGSTEVRGALGFVRTLNEVGQPLGGVTIEEAGSTNSTVSDSTSGVATVSGAGPRVWRFSRTGYLPSWRGGSLVSGEVRLIPYPRLPRRAGFDASITPLNGGSITNNAAILRFIGGAFGVPTHVRLSLLDGQNLPLLLPPGWSPVQAVWIEMETEPASPATLAIAPWTGVSPTEAITVARLNTNSLHWEAVGTVAGNGSSPVSLPVGASGAYALVLRDTGAFAPPAATLNAPLPAGTISSSGSVSAGGEVTPSISPASTLSEEVTAQAQVAFTNSTGTATSGTLYHTRVAEDYRLQDGTGRQPPGYEQFIVAYQRPGDNQPETLHSHFPIRPRFLFGPGELIEAVVRVEVLPAGGFSGGVLGSSGGVTGNGSVRIFAGQGAISGEQAVRVIELISSNFTNLVQLPQAVVSAFELEIGGLTNGGRLALQLTGLPTNGTFVLGRVVGGQGLTGIEPVERLQTDAAGILKTAEPASGARLPGIDGSGQFVMVQVDPQQGLVSGIARTAGGIATNGLPVRVMGQPWLAFSMAGGAYQILAPPGENTVLLGDAGAGESARQTVTVSASLGPVNAALIAGIEGLRIVSVSPTNLATRVPKVATVTVQFNRAVNPATVLGGGVQVLETNGQPVAASVSLNLANRVVTVLPSGPLDSSGTYRIVVSAGVRDAAGRAIEGVREFSFQTVPVSTRDPAAQLIIYEPGATNVPSTVLQNIPAYRPGTNSTAIVVRGTPGAADPEVPVVLVNESSGETATVLSKPDGSFASVIDGSEEDFVSATFVNLNGSRVYVPVSRQLFDNGFVGLYRQGGILEAQSDGGPVRVYIEPEAIRTKTKLRLKTLSLAQLMRELEGTQPEAAKLMAGGLTLETEGAAPEGPIKVSFNVDLRAVGYPTNADPREAAVVLARVNESQGVKAFEVLDQLKFTPADEIQAQQGRLRALAGPDKEQLFYGAVQSVVGFLPGGDLAQGVFKYIMVPLLIGGRPIVVKGRTLQSYEVTKLQNPFSIEDPLLSGLSYGLLGRAGGVVDNFSNAIDLANSFTEQLSDGLMAKPLSGSLVTLQNFQTPVTPGRLRSGMVYATSDRDGRYLMVAPTTPALSLTPEDIYLLIATHPKFKDRESQGLFALTDISLAGVVFKDFVFREPLPFTTAPQVNIAHSPPYPAPGEPVQLQVNASQGFAGEPKVNVFVESVFPTNQTTAAVTLAGATTPLSANRVRWQGMLQASNAVRGVIVRVSVISAAGVVHPALRYRVSFDGEPPQPEGPIPSSDPDDVQGPSVVASAPVERGYVDESGKIRISFTEPIDRSVEKNVKGIVLTGGEGALVPAVVLSPDQTELTIDYAGLVPDSEYALTLTGDSIRDMKGNPLDQRPSTREADSFTVNFRTAPAVRIALPGVVNGRGSAMNGSFLYVIDAADQNLLRTFDVSNPNSPKLLSSVRVAGMPRDLVVIPNYAFKTKLHGATKTNDLVAVVGGDLKAVVDHLDTVIVAGQYIRVFDMGDPSNPVELAAPVVTYRVGSAVTKVRWHPPHLVYQEFAADLHQIAFVNLQELIIGFNATRPEIDVFPDAGKEGQDFTGDGDYVDGGVDANNDGDFDDPGDTKADTMPLPPRRPAEFFGKKSSHVIEGTTQKILDFSLSGGTLGVTLSRGVLLSPGGRPTDQAVPPQYRTITFNDFEVNPGLGSVNFANGDYPARLLIVDGLPIQYTNGLRTPVVALVTLSPDRLGRHSIEVMDISQPEDPRQISLLQIPDEVANGQLLSMHLRPDGYIELVTSTHIVLLDSLQFAKPTPPEGQAHPSIVGFIPQAGSRMKSAGSSPAGLRAVADGGRNHLVQTPPPISFVYFPQNSILVDPRNLPRNDSALQSLYAKAVPASQLTPARVRSGMGQVSQLFPTDPSVHYYVMVQAPGGSNATIRLGLESLSFAGWPMPNKGAGFAPVRAVSADVLSAMDVRMREECDAPIRELMAYRMSNDPKSPFYNRYLSRPFAVVYESMSIADLNLQRLETDREILWSGASMRAFIDPSEIGNPVIGRFAARVDDGRKLLYPIASATVPTLDVSYIMGDNPPPAGGGLAMPGTGGAVMAHSGEVRTEASDMAIPSPRMPISIVRSIGGQDNYEGPFGMGWDYNYNQRLTELLPHIFPEGLKMPLVQRATLDDSVVANSKDVLFHTGAGRMIHFRWISDEIPAEYAEDPLVREYNYRELAASYFLPEPGSFDLLVKFKDGKYERLTPEGMRFRYNAAGRLEAQIDAFPKNRHEFEYDRNGWLIRIDDRSVTADRYVEIGYYRRDTDPDYRAGIDERTANTFWDGKICRLRDFAGGDVLFFYNDEGLLIRREGVEVAGDNEGFSGRPQTHYNYKQCKLIGVSSGLRGEPVFNAVTENSEEGDPVAQSGTGASGPVALNIPRNNKASSLENQVTASTQGQERTVEQQLDKNGFPKRTTVSGGDGPPAEMEQEYNEHGLVTFIKFPEGRIERYAYDTNNVNYRSRGNLLAKSVNPGLRGGPSYVETSNYDPRYNLEAGDQVDANGFTTTITLRSDGREIASTRYGGAGTETRTFNDVGQLEESEDITGRITRTRYNGATGFLASTDRGEHTFEYGYDSSYAAKLGRATSVRPPEGAATEMKYNANLQAVEIRRGGLAELRGYDEQGRAVYVRQEVGDGKAHVNRMTFNAAGFMTRTVSLGVEVNGNESPITYEYAPDRLSRVESIKHPDGMVETFKYDSRGNRTQRKLGTYAEEAKYDLNSNLIEVRQGGDLVMTMGYDGHDRTTNIVRKTGSSEEVETSSYYPGGQLRSHVVSDTRFGTAYRQTIDQIDELGRPVRTTLNGQEVSPTQEFVYAKNRMTVRGSRLTTESTWDDSGYETGYSDPLRKITVRPDGSGRVREIQSEEGGTTYTQTFGYDALDNRISISDLLGARFSYLTRADGEFLAVTNARNNAVTMEHTSLGELLRERREDGMEFRFRHDEERQPAFTGDPGAGFAMEYDTQFRLTRRTLRNGSEIRYSDFDARNMPRSIAIPGGNIVAAYDLQRRPTFKTVNYQGSVYETGQSYDGMGRVRVETYRTGSGGENQASYEFDASGVLKSERYQENGADYTVGYDYYSDGTRKTVIYPSGQRVTETRDVTGRLTGLSDPNGNILQANAWQGHNQPRDLTLGGGIQIINQFDRRGRMTGSRYTKSGDGSVPAHMRYRLNGADELELRQDLHRGGKADQFAYDNAERVDLALVGGFPTNATGVLGALYARDYRYSDNGLDLLLAASLTGTNAPAFAAAWGGHDAFLVPTVVDASGRTSDVMGNVARTRLEVRAPGANGSAPVEATLVHNGLGNLVRIERADGVTIENEYQPSGLRYARRLLRNGSLIEHRHFVYDSDARLIEEYERAEPGAGLIARYYYGSSDAPVAADLRETTAGPLERFYFARDLSESVVAVLDRNGNAVERVWYDPYGQPVIESKDSAGPKIRRVLAGTGGSLSIELSESVVPFVPDPGPGSAIVPVELGQFTNLVSGIVGRSELVPSAPGLAPYSLIRFVPRDPITNQVPLALNPEFLTDDWGNRAATETVTIAPPNGAASGSILYAAAASNTSPVRTARSKAGSPFLFHGQYFDYDSGLVYMRARFYDPASGMFLEPDPLGYEDSVNLYAAFGNNPVSMRDPTGLKRKKSIQEVQQRHRSREQAGSESYDFLSGSGMTDLEIEAISNVLQRRNQNITLSIRRFQKYDQATGAKLAAKTGLFRRAAATAGWLLKGAGFKAKNNIFAHGKLKTKKRSDKGEGSHTTRITSDLDALHVMIDGQFASVKEIRQLFGDINREFRTLHKARYAHMGSKAPRANAPFQHEAHAHLLHQLGQKVGTKVGKKGYVSYEDLGGIGHPGDAFQLSFTRGSQGLAARDLERGEVDSILQMGREDFMHQKENSSLMDQLDGVGLLEVTDWPPSWYKRKGWKEEGQP